MSGTIYLLFSDKKPKVYIGKVSRGDNMYLPQRLYEHQYNWMNEARGQCSSAAIFNQGKPVNITALEHVNGGDIDIRLREQHWIDEYKRRGFEVVNKHNAVSAKVLRALAKKKPVDVVPVIERMAGADLVA